MKNQIQRGEVITIVAAADIVSGDLVKVGDLIGVAGISALTGHECEVALKGVYEVPKAAGAISQGVKVYYDAAAKNITTTATSNTLAGYAFVAALNGDTVMQLLLAQ